MLHYQGLAIGIRRVRSYATFISIRMILDMHTLTRTLIFLLWYFKVFKNFPDSFNFILFKNLLLYVWLLFVCPWKRQILYCSHLFLKILIFHFFPTNYFVNSFPGLWPLANLRCQWENKLKWLRVYMSFLWFYDKIIKNPYIRTII